MIAAIQDYMKQMQFDFSDGNASDTVEFPDGMPITDSHLFRRRTIGADATFQ